MKLSAEQISCIEALLALRAKGVTNTEIANRLKLDSFGQQKVSCAFILLEAIGLPVKQARKGRRAGFKPKTLKAGDQPKPSQPRRVFLSSDQWQERLAQMGH